MPLNAALTIAAAGGNDKDVHTALQVAYEDGQLRGVHPIQACKAIEMRRSFGTSVARLASQKVFSCFATFDDCRGRQSGSNPRAALASRRADHVKKFDGKSQKGIRLREGPTHIPAWFPSKGATFASAIRLAREGGLPS